LNKAFVKEPEPAEPRCPPPSGGCDAIGLPVTRTTLRAQLSEEDADRFAGSAFYCPSPNCDIAYFDPWGVTIPRSEIRSEAYPKSAGAPVCSCFGVTADEILRRATSGEKAWARDQLARAESAEAKCETEAPSGESCVAEFRKIFLKYFTPE